MSDNRPEEGFEAPIFDRCHFNPNVGLGETSDLYERAAGGDQAAIRSLRDQFALICEVPPGSPLALLVGTEALSYARLCAARGTVEDARVLAGVLCYTFAASQHAGYGDRALVLVGQAVSILERLAEHGDEVSALASNELVSVNPIAGDIAKRLLQGSN